MKSRVIITAVCLLAILPANGCSKKTEETHETIYSEENVEDSYETAVAQLGDVYNEVEIDLKMSASETYKLSFNVDNRLIEQVNVKKGDYVEKGDLLAALDIKDVSDELEEVKFKVDSLNLSIKQKEEMRDLELEQAKEYYEGYTLKTDDDYDDYKDKKKSIEDNYKRTLEDLKDQLKINTDKQELLEQKLEEGSLYAPINGRITNMSDNLENSYIKKDETIITISNTDSYYFVTDSLTYKDYFNEGEEYTLTIHENGEDVSYLVKPANMDKWDEEMYFELEEGEELAADTSGKLTLVLDKKEKVLTVPTKAIHTSKDGPFVYVSEDGLLKMQYVTVGLSGEELTEIVDGLSEGSEVAIN